MPVRVESYLEESARRTPDKTALVVGDARYTYADLNAMANRLAHDLRGRGVKRGDRVALFLENSVEAVVGLFAALKAGAVFCMVNPTTKADKLAYILNNCRATALITHTKLSAVAEEARSDSPSVEVYLPLAGPEDLNTEPNNPSAQAAPEHGGIDLDLAMIVYTSGSTGFPKGVMMTHQNVHAAATSITTYLESTPDDVIMNVLPISFDYGLYQVLMGVKAGGTVVLEKSFTFPFLILRKMKEEKVTGFPLVPTMAAILLQMKDLRPGDFPHLRYLTNTAAALPPAHIERLGELFPQAKLYSMYGLTECKRCTYLPPEQLKIRPGSVGKAIPFTEAWIVNEQGERAQPGEVGELVIRGAHVMKGYWENEEETNRKLRPGPYPWEKVLHTGDLFRMDEEGYLYFVGRMDDILKCRGEKVSPKEIENALYALPGVKEAAVIGVPDPVLGMAIKAIVVPAEGSALTEKDVMVHCKANLEDLMVPKFVELRDALPKTDTGKIRRSEVQAEALRQAAESLQGRAGAVANEKRAPEGAGR
ncbi:MAG: AMP-binding protein [Armatimonadetes bacterium]|nr:AMP-binding protein [Armatimonadota bacterium]